MFSQEVNALHMKLNIIYIYNFFSHWGKVIDCTYTNAPYSVCMAELSTRVQLSRGSHEHWYQLCYLDVPLHMQPPAACHWMHTTSRWREDVYEAAAQLELETLSAFVILLSTRCCGVWQWWASVPLQHMWMCSRVVFIQSTGIPGPALPFPGVISDESASLAGC